jgi:hypothetical protein
MKLIGTREIADALDGMDKKLSMSLLRSFNRKAIQRNALPGFIDAAHSRRGRESIKIVPSPRDKNKTSLMVGPTSKAFFERFLEGGTKKRTTKKGWNRGSIRANRTYIQAAENSIDPIIDYSNNNLGEEIKKYLEKRLKTVRSRRSKLN